jgi:hypothetical protein
MLVFFPVSPDTGLGRSEYPAIRQSNLILCGNGGCPDFCLFAVGLEEFVPTAPATPGGRMIPSEAILDQAKKRRRVSFHDILERKVVGAKRAMVFPDILFKPRIVHQFECILGPILVPTVATDSRPSSTIIFLPTVSGARIDDEENPGKSVSNPLTGKILIGNRINTEFATNFSRSAAERVFLTFHNACARQLAPPQTDTQSGRSSALSTALIRSSEPGESFPPLHHPSQTPANVLLSLLASTPWKGSQQHACPDLPLPVHNP